MKTENYWRDRFAALEDSAHVGSVQYIQDMEREFRTASHAIRSDIERWYARFAENNQISMAEARRRLTAGQLEEFRWTVQDYIRAGESLGSAWAQQLENASARVHISRLDALKLQMQQQVELLYGNQTDAFDALLRKSYIEGYYHTAFEVQRGMRVGWGLHSLDDKQLESVLSKPWTADNRTFRDRCWQDKAQLVNTLQTQMTQAIIRGDAPGKAIKAITDRFRVSKNKAACLVMTESAYFSARAQKDCFNMLGVAKYEVVVTLDELSCEVCGSLDGKVFPMPMYEPGVTANPFHPRCRCCTAPYFADLGGERAARDLDGEHISIPANMKYDEWKREFVDKARQERYNNKRDQIRQRIRTEYPLTVHAGHQNKHIAGTKEYDPTRSTLTAAPEELLALYAGKGDPIRSGRGEWRQKERFTHTSEIGVWRNKDTGVELATTRGIIHYSKKKGAHIVPAEPEVRRRNE